MICDPLWQSSSHNNIEKELGRKVKERGSGCERVKVRGKKAKEKQKNGWNTHKRWRQNAVIERQALKSGYQNTMKDWNAGKNEKV